jgi:diaminopimelate epimerase
MTIKVDIMSGAGNLFSVIDYRKSDIEKVYLNKLTPLLCKKENNGIMNTEGLLIIDSGQYSYDLNIDFYNPDGSTSMMCGNGARCAIRYAVDYGILAHRSEDELIVFRMAGNLYKAQIKKDSFKIYLPPPTEISLDLMFTVSYGKVFADYVNVNSDHLLIFKNDFEKFFGLRIEEIDLNQFAPELRHHSSLPNGANVNIYSIDNGSIHIRTYERGVEAETGACGTGAISAGLIGAIKHNLKFPITVIPKSGQKLIVDIIGDIQLFIEAIILEGNAEFIDSFTFNID